MTRDHSLADMLALDSARISGYENNVNNDEAFERHQTLMRIIVEGPGRLINPVILNMELCGDVRLALRRGMPGGQHGHLPEGKYTRALLKYWWWKAESFVKHLGTESEETRSRFCWMMHDLLLSIHPFTRGNGRTARLSFYMLQRATGIPLSPIRYEKAPEYLSHCEVHQNQVFVPLMRKHGFMSG
jgi:hypothetical protein